MRKLIATSATAALLFSGGALATPLTGLNNTGVGVNNNGQDTNYTVTTVGLPNSPLSASNGFGTTTGGADGNGNALNLQGSQAYVAPANDSYIPTAGSASGATGQWIPSTDMGNGSFSSWITPLTPSSISLDPSVNGEYMYQTTFTISGNQNLLSAQLSGAWAADNFGYITLNGNVIASINDPRNVGQADGAAYDSWNSIAAVANSDFKYGTNTLDFYVYNIGQSSGNPTGLRADFISSITSAVPEPTEGTLLLAGLGLLGFIATRRKSV